MFLENKNIDERISRAIDNDHTAAMKSPVESRKHTRKKGTCSFSSPDMISVCMLCKKAFKNHLFYRKHLRLHAEKAFSCQICGKGFVKKYYLQAHMQTHAKHQYQCPVCHKRFAQKSNLNQHMKFHSSKKAFKCNICEKDFYQQEHLKTHLRFHTSERPFECELCHKSFNIKSSLQRHMNCHTGEKPFICDICNRGYTRRSVLMLHIQQVHENKKPFQCDECHLCFSQKGNLQAHFRRKHLQPKSEGKRGKDKDGGKGKRGIKRQHSRASSKTVKICASKNFVMHLSSNADESGKIKVNKTKIDNTSLHSYASKVKTIINRSPKTNIQSSDEPKAVTKSPKSSPYQNNSFKEQSNGQCISYNSLKSGSLDNSNSCSLSDETLDIGCSSSSGEDIPDLNFPSIFDHHADVIPYDIKSFSGFETLLEDNKGWEDYIMGDGDILGSSLVSYDLSDALSSPVKSNIVLTRAIVDSSEDLFSNNLSWNDDYANPLFTADDLDNIKDISSVCGTNSIIQNNIDNKKVDISDQDKRIYNSQNSRNVNNLTMQKIYDNSLQV